MWIVQEPRATLDSRPLTANHAPYIDSYTFPAQKTMSSLPIWLRWSYRHHTVYGIQYCGWGKQENAHYNYNCEKAPPLSETMYTNTPSGICFKHGAQCQCKRGRGEKRVWALSATVAREAPDSHFWRHYRQHGVLMSVYRSRFMVTCLAWLVPLGPLPVRIES